MGGCGSVLDLQGVAKTRGLASARNIDLIERQHNSRRVSPPDQASTTRPRTSGVATVGFPRAEILRGG